MTWAKTNADRPGLTRQNATINVYAGWVNYSSPMDPSWGMDLCFLSPTKNAITVQLFWIQ